MITINLPPKQINAILVALDAEIECQLHGRPVDWESSVSYTHLTLPTNREV